jgi:GntR family transcriptional repressor for pyruvate dehydrogenase complex
MALFTRVDKTTVPDTVMGQVMDLIRSGALKPGDRLPTEHGLSEQLGVGRSSVREALKALEALGLVKRRKEGSFVSEDLALPAYARAMYLDMLAQQLEINHVYQARRLLETELGALAVQNMTEEDLEELEALCREMEQTPDDQVQKHVQLDRRFHETISELAGNPVLTRLWGVAFDILFEIRQRIPFTPQNIRHSDVRHRLLLEALRSRDAERVRQTITETLVTGERMLVARLAELEQERAG